MILLNLHPIRQKQETLTLRRVTLEVAQERVRVWHRHSDEVTGHRFSLGAVDGRGGLRGVAICGRPIAPGYDPERVLEVARVATDGAKNACSFLYGASLRAARALGFERAITYTKATEPGASLRAAGWGGPFEVEDGERDWSRPGRRRTTQAVMFELPQRERVARVRWEVWL